MPNVGDGSVLPVDPISVAKKAYQAYVEKDRAVIEALVADDFHFSNPLDNCIDHVGLGAVAVALAFPPVPRAQLQPA